MAAPRVLRDLARGALDLVFAPVCLGCRAPVSPELEERRVCRACWARSRAIPSPRCDRCWSPLRLVLPGGPTIRCALCEELPPYLRAVRSAFLLDGPPRELVHGLKYGGWSSLAAAMADRMARLALPREVEDEVRLVVPTPVSPVRLRQRGYNQAALLARAVAARRGWTFASDLLIRTRASETQTTLHPSERRANVAGAFSARPGSEASFLLEHVLLVDDVWTTGATALACGKALTDAGARSFSVLTFARALPELVRTERE